MAPEFSMKLQIQMRVTLLVNIFMQKKKVFQLGYDAIYF